MFASVILVISLYQPISTLDAIFNRSTMVFETLNQCKVYSSDIINELRRVNDDDTGVEFIPYCLKIEDKFIKPNT